MDIREFFAESFSLCIIICFFSAIATRYLLYAFCSKDAYFNSEFVLPIYTAESFFAFAFIFISHVKSIQKWFIDYPFLVKLIFYSAVLDIVLILIFFFCKVRRLRTKEILLFELYIIMAKLRICEVLDPSTFLLLLAAITMMFIILLLLPKNNKIRVIPKADH